MFIYTAHDPESALSVLAASFRLYFASFLYALTLSIVSSLTFLATNFFIENHIDPNTNLYEILPAVLSTILSLIFFIPLIKRIYSVGANLPITTAEAFRGFFMHFYRLLILVILTGLAASILPAIFAYSKIEVNTTVSVILLFMLLFIYIYIGLRIYFTSLFIVLENKGIWESLKASFRIEHNHMWLTFCVLTLYVFGFWTVISFTSGYFVWQPLGVDLYTLLLSIVTLPLFLSIQICQFFNLKKLAKQ